MEIPQIVWFAVIAGCLAGCLAWHRKTNSRHLLFAAGGLGWILFLSLPGIYSELFGHVELSRFADKLFKDANWAGERWDSTGELLVFLCGLLAWPGSAFLALGLWRQGSSLTPAITKPLER